MSVLGFDLISWKMPGIEKENHIKFVRVFSSLDNLTRTGIGHCDFKALVIVCDTFVLLLDLRIDSKRKLFWDRFGQKDVFYCRIPQVQVTASWTAGGNVVVTPRMICCVEFIVVHLMDQFGRLCAQRGTATEKAG